MIQFSSTTITLYTDMNTPVSLKMEQEPTASTAKEKQPVRLPKSGYLDDAFSISKGHRHPVVLREFRAALDSFAKSRCATR
jgi:hypothetical protein